MRMPSIDVQCYVLSYCPHPIAGVASPVAFLGQLQLSTATMHPMMSGALSAVPETRVDGATIPIDSKSFCIELPHPTDKKFLLGRDTLVSCTTGMPLGWALAHCSMSRMSSCARSLCRSARAGFWGWALQKNSVGVWGWAPGSGLGTLGIPAVRHSTDCLGLGTPKKPGSGVGGDTRSGRSTSSKCLPKICPSVVLHCIFWGTCPISSSAAWNWKHCSPLQPVHASNPAVQVHLDDLSTLISWSTPSRSSWNSRPRSS